MNEENILKLVAKDAMIKPILIYEDDDSEKILKKLKREDINACIVVDKDKRLIGEISDNDIIKLFLHQVKYEPLVQLLNRGYRRNFLYKKAKDIVSKKKVFVRKETPINEVIEVVFKNEFQYVPVLNDNDEVVGVITPSSLINLLKKY
ncbi:MAG: hypothetical protein PWR32_789 [Candidatus Woesearchaeota archaeon]|nr:hypothetical protein [Candidatus Woesearchaeota archaeon]